MSDTQRNMPASDPEYRVERLIGASPERVWEIISDLRRMGERSPQCRRMLVLGGEIGEGTRTVNINRRGPVFWPTTARITRWEPNRELAFTITENHTTWSYSLVPEGDGTRVVERRTRDGSTWLSDFMVRRVLGGEETFRTEMLAGMAATLAAVAEEAERG